MDSKPWLVCCSLFSHKQVIGFAAAMQQLGGPAPNTSEALREAVCGAAKKLAGWRDGDTAEKALELLTQKCPAELRRLLKEVGKFEDKVIQSELDALTQRVDVLEKEMVVVKSDITGVSPRYAPTPYDSWPPHPMTHA